LGRDQGFLGTAKHGERPRMVGGNSHEMGKRSIGVPLRGLGRGYGHGPQKLKKETKERIKDNSPRNSGVIDGRWPGNGLTGGLQQTHGTTKRKYHGEKINEGVLT